MMKAERQHAIILQHATALDQDMGKLTREHARVLVLNLAHIGRIGFVKPGVAMLQDGRQPGEKEVAELTVMHEIEVGRIGDHGINGTVWERQSGAIAVEDQYPLVAGDELRPRCRVRRAHRTAGDDLMACVAGAKQVAVQRDLERR